STQEWLSEKSKDLARSLAVFWVSLGADSRNRYASAQKAIEAMQAESKSGVVEKFKVTYLSYGLNNAEAKDLLTKLSIAEIARSVVNQLIPEAPIAEDLTESIAKAIADVPKLGPVHKEEVYLKARSGTGRVERRSPDRDPAYARMAGPYIDAMRAH